MQKQSGVIKLINIPPEIMCGIEIYLFNIQAIRKFTT